MAGPVSGSAYTFTLSLFSQSTGNVIQNPTIAAGDFNISTDGGALTPLATTPTVTPANSYIVEFNLTSGEVGSDHFTVVCVDAAGSEWKDIVYHETVQAKNDTVDVDAIVDGVWDEALSGHNIGGSTGKALRQLKDGVISEEAAVNDASPTSLGFVTTLASTTSSFYTDAVLHFTSGPAQGQSRIIVNYNGSTKAVTFDEELSVLPDDGDDFIVLSLHAHSVNQIADGVWDEAQSGHTTPGTFGYYLDDQVSSIVSDFGTVILSAEIVTQDFEGSIIAEDFDASLVTQDVEDADIVSQDITGTTITQDYEGNISQ